MRNKSWMSRAIVLLVAASYSSLPAADTVFSWNFEASDPSYAYSLGFAGQGTSDCLVDLSNNAQVSTDHRMAGGVASAQLDTSNWNVPTSACWSYAGWEFGLGHDLERNGQQLVSDDLSQYQLSFDAWVEGTGELPSVVQVHMQDKTQTDALGNAMTRVVIGNNRNLSDGDLDPILLSSDRRSFSISLDRLGFSDLNNDGRPPSTQRDLTNYISQITSLNVEIEPQGRSGRLAGETEAIGIDIDNRVFLDNVKLTAPLKTVSPPVTPPTTPPPIGTLISWDFEATSPAYTYANVYAGQGSADCFTNVDNSNQVTVNAIQQNGAATATFDSSNWWVAGNACYSYAGFEYGLGHSLSEQQQFTSDDLSLYEVTFDAWVEGSEPLPAIVQVHLQDNSTQDASGNPTTRVVLGNNRELNDGDQNPFLIGTTRQTFSISLASLGFADFNNDGIDDYSQQDVSSYFANITSLNIEIEPQGTSGVVASETTGRLGTDANNILRIDNVSFTAPFRTLVACETNRNGDINGDGQVDFSDFLVVSANFGQEVPSHAEGDLNCSGTVDFADFLAVSDNFGQTVGASSVPEPSSALLLCIAFAVLLCSRRRRDRSS